MRLWSLHPEYLDTRGLVAAWREALLAQAVLRGRTRGYRHHPQLQRFKACSSPVGAVAEYLRGLHAESLARGFRFDASRIARARAQASLQVTRGQLRHEWAHLLAKLRERDPERAAAISTAARPRPHPLFRMVPGGVEAWERTEGSTGASRP